jgi:hypothetical protein
MNYVALDLNTGKPQPGDLVWSALPDAPVAEPRPRRGRLRLVLPIMEMVRRWRLPGAHRNTPRRDQLPCEAISR